VSPCLRFEGVGTVVEARRPENPINAKKSRAPRDRFALAVVRLRALSEGARSRSDHGRVANCPLRPVEAMRADLCLRTITDWEWYRPHPQASSQCQQAASRSAKPSRCYAFKVAQRKRCLETQLADLLSFNRMARWGSDGRPHCCSEIL
jgi:hypothetical protein